MRRDPNDEPRDSHRLCVFLGFAVTLQALSGAYAVDFAGNPDEPAHYVTGVMVRDYLAAFPWQPPMTFARNFYSHYPIVAIGHWPPMFYVVQAAWTLPFGVSRLSVLLLMAMPLCCHSDRCFCLMAAAFRHGCRGRARFGVSVGSHRSGARPDGDGRNAGRAVHAAGRRRLQAVPGIRASGVIRCDSPWRPLRQS